MPVDVYDAAAWMSVTALSENRLQRARAAGVSWFHEREMDKIVRVRKWRRAGTPFPANIRNNRVCGVSRCF